jgi:DNA-binding XRE family transcriptional regulator
MPGKTLPYDVDNNLSKFIRMYHAQLIMSHGTDSRIMVSEIEKEIAEYCGITLHTLKAYRHGRCLPSLPCALMFAQFFETDVTNIFPLNKGANKREEILQRNSL